MNYTLDNLYTDGHYHFAVPGSGPIFLDELNCVENFDSLFDCHSLPASEPSSCDHSQDIGIQCKGDTFYLSFFIFTFIMQWLKKYEGVVA